MHVRHALLCAAAILSSPVLAEDTGLSSSLGLDQRGDILRTRLNEAGAFVDAEILRLGKDRVAQFLKQEPAFGLMNNAGGSACSTLTNADIPWPKVKLSTDEEVTIDGSACTKYREAANHDDRKNVMDAFFATRRS